LSSQADISRAKSRYRDAQESARRQSAVNLVPRLSVEFYLTNWSRRAAEAHAAQWALAGARPHAEGGWDWNEIFRRHRNDMDALDIVIWGPSDRLCGLSLITANSTAVCVEWVEGDPRLDCPLLGKRALISLEAAGCYAQALGRREIRLKPISDALADLYQRVYGFVLENPPSGTPYYRREV
jgi:hypothetical protein